jgi:Matrixin
MASLMPHPPPTPLPRVQPSMRSVPSAASTVRPEADPPGGEEPPKRPARRRLWFFGALSMVAGVLAASAFGNRTPTLTADVRSGSPGFKQSATGKNVHWQRNAVTVYLDESLQRLGPTTNEAVMQAFGRWVASDPNLPSISFDTRAGAAEPKQDGKSTVSFGRISAPGHEQDVAITITYSDSKSGEILEADMVLNAKYAMGVLKARHHGDGGGPLPVPGPSESDECGNRYDAQNVATHEAGHFFGLGEDMVERRATMFLSIDQCETHKRELQPTDVTAVSLLYADAASAEEKAAGPRACAFAGPSRPGSSLAWSGALVLGFALARRRVRR